MAGPSCITALAPRLTSALLTASLGPGTPHSMMWVLTALRFWLSEQKLHGTPFYASGRRRILIIEYHSSAWLTTEEILQYPLR